MEITESTITNIIDESIINFSSFIKYVFPLSFKEFKETSHLFEWANRIQNNKKTATLSARKHLKSTLMYAYIMWRILRMEDNEDWLYMSYTEPLSRYHTKNIKRLIQKNPLFKAIIDLTPAESSLRYTWDNKNIFSLSPASILRFNRGWHGYGVICDDILSDPTNELNLTIINTINQTFFEEILSLPVEGGELHLVGTAQHYEDLFFQIKNKALSFNWAFYPAVLDEINKITLWPEMFSYERLMQIRDNEIGEKAFNKEYMCTPVWSEDSYFKREEIIKCVDNGLTNLKGVTNNEATVIGGLDIGKSRHPSHFTLFLHSNGLIIQIYQIWMDNWDYTKQVNFINNMIDDFKIKTIYYDDTRGELESFREQGMMSRIIWRPIKFSQSEKFKMASNFSSHVVKGIIKLQNNPRTIRSILSVNNSLDAIESAEGHGDAFWSICLALNHKIHTAPYLHGWNRFT